MDISGWLIVVLYLLLPLGQLQRLPLGIEGASVYVHDLVLMAIWVWILFRQKRDLSASLEMTKNNQSIKRFVVFTAVALLSWLINLSRWGRESIIGLGYLIRWVLLAGPLVFYQLLPDDQRMIIDTKKIFKLLKQSIFLLAIFGWVQYFLFPDLTRMKYFGWDDHFFRLTGTLLDPNFFGILMIIGLFLEFKSYGLRVTGFLKKIFYLITLAFTYSRASYLAWLILLFGWGINRIFAEPVKGGVLKLGKIFFRSLTTYTVYFWLAVSAIIFVLIPRPEGEGGDLARTASIVGRHQSYQEVISVIKENPVIGVGFNNMRIVNSQGSTNVNHAAGGADNSFLFVWATTGIIGLIVFIWLVFSLRPWWLVLPVIVHSFFNNTLFFPWVLIYLWSIQLLSDRTIIENN